MTTLPVRLTVGTVDAEVGTVEVTADGVVVGVVELLREVADTMDTEG